MAILRVTDGPADQLQLHWRQETQRWDRPTKTLPNASQAHNSLYSSQLESALAHNLADAGKAHTSIPGLPFAPNQTTQHATAVTLKKQKGPQKIIWQLMPDTPVGRALVSATQRLESLEFDTAHLDAQVILAHIMDVDRAWLFAHHEVKLTEEQAEQFTNLIVRRMNHEPVAYLIGRKEFYGLDFVVDSRVLIPRPETELLVDAVLSHLEVRSDELPIGHRLNIVDVGTGCGVIALSVVTNAPNVQAFAIDISRDALEIARANARRLDKRCQVSLLEGDLLAPLSHKVDRDKVDIIVANLPYINTWDYATLAPDVRDFEPQLALEAGPKGLDSIGRLLEQAHYYLNPKGVIFLEIGYDQGEEILSLVKHHIPQATFVDLRQDYNGRDRLITIAI
ncbi:MAG: peptide chain release factor N(5)-glutamine methyltransferase [Chloroflexota bacterium]